MAKAKELLVTATEALLKNAPDATSNNSSPI